MKRIIKVAAISGIISSIITLLLLLIFPSGWLFFIIPAVMGTCIHKFGRITATDVEKDEKLEKKVGLMCAGAVLLFIFLTYIPALIYCLHKGLGGSLLLDIPFYICCVLAVWYGYNRGVRAVIDSYYDSGLKDDNQ
ncbi:MAG: hypothetical protein II905_02200 [Muribaculaceae bacterium]|nr:hypothetical protein [Muribaculaceae bacterium]